MIRKNSIKKEALSEELQKEMSEQLEEKVEHTQNFLKNLFRAKALSSNSVAKNLPFVGFIALLGILYISNRHLAENTVRSIDKLGREVKELGWDYKSFNAELMKLTTQSEVSKRADTLGLVERLQPPIKITIQSTSKVD